jgi:hypothetical protein
MAATARHGSRRRRITLTITSTAVLSVVMCLGWTAAAQATMRIVNQLDPAGDPTLVLYHFSSPTFSPYREFVLGDGSAQTYGGDPGQYTAQAFPPTGYQVGAIQCVGPRGDSDFVVDVPGSKVTITHVNPATDNQTCTFTIRKVTSTGGGSGASGSPPAAGSPAPPAQELTGVSIPQKAALIRVGGGRHFAVATVRVPRRAIVTGRLLWHGKEVGRARVVHAAGTYSLRIPIKRSQLTRLQRGGRSRVTLGLRLVVKETHGPTKVFGYGVIVSL